MMKRMAAGLVFCVTMALTGCSDRCVCPEGDRYETGAIMNREALVRYSNSFGIRLFKELVNERPDSNVVVSPLSAALALGMTANGAGGATLDSILSVLGFADYSLKSANECYQGLMEFLGGLDPQVEFEVANSIWCRAGFQFKRTFFERCCAYFDSEPRSLDFGLPGAADTINAWVNEKTHGRIKGIVRKPIPEIVVMYLLDAIYFLGTWKDEFDPAYTGDDWFSLADGSDVPCRMMKRPGPEPDPGTYILSDFVYYSDDSLQIVDLPYGDSLFTMTVLLPKPNTDLESFISDLTPERWDWWIGNLKDCHGRLLMPKFELEYETELKDALGRLGMGVAFRGEADFSGMADMSLFITDVRHKTYVKVDEVGTEAAAVTMVEISTGNTPDCAHFEMAVQRPFLFVIRENVANTIIFIGKVAIPRHI
jgi:serine protease inhibitor